MKIAIISDLHGNYEAVRSLPEGYDELWVLGDLVNYGPEPGSVIDFVKARSSVVVRGNHDHSIGYDVDPRCTARYQKMAEMTRKYSASVLKKEQKTSYVSCRSVSKSSVKTPGSISVTQSHPTRYTGTVPSNLTNGPQN